MMLGVLLGGVSVCLFFWARERWRNHVAQRPNQIGGGPRPPRAPLSLGSLPQWLWYFYRTQRNLHPQDSRLACLVEVVDRTKLILKAL